MPWQFLITFFSFPQKMNYRANNEKSKNFVKTVNHLVAFTEALDLQRLPFLIYSKNHLVIVWMVLLYVLGTGRTRIVPKWGKHLAHFRQKSVVRACRDDGRIIITDIHFCVGVVSPSYGGDTNQKMKHGLHGAPRIGLSQICFFDNIWQMILRF